MSRVREFALPDLGEGLTEGEILKWLVAVGDTVELNQPIVEVETAKAAVEIPAMWAGQVTEIFHAEGTLVEVGSPIIAIDTQPSAPAPARASGLAPAAGPSQADSAQAEPAAGLIGGSAPGGRTAVLVGYGPRTGPAKRRTRAVAPGIAAEPPAFTAEPPAFTAEPPAFAAEPPGIAAEPPARTDPGPPSAVVLCKPPVRKLARDLGVDLRLITGSGPQGSITRDDVQRAVSVPATAGAGTSYAAPGPSFGADRERRVPVRGVRKLTAQNMVASAFAAPHVTEFLTVDMTRAIKALGRLRGRSEWRDVRVSPLLLVAKAVLLAIRRHPMVNSSWMDDEIVVKEYVNLGIAAATERGLIVPNIKDAGRLSLRELAEEMSALVQTAKSGRTSPADMSGGTFTITNIGVFGVDTGTPILPPGEAAILAFGVVRETPWVHKGKIRVRQVTTLSMSFDHRIIDGELGSLFLRDVGDFLTDPEAALLAWS